MKTKWVVWIFVIVAFIPRMYSQVHYLNLDDVDIVGNSNYVISYDLTMAEDSLRPQEKSHDVIILEIGDSFSKSYSHNIYRWDSAVTLSRRKGSVSENASRLEALLPIDVLKDYPKGKMKVYHRAPMTGPVFCYEEHMPMMKWRIEKERKGILGYSCQKAVAVFRGRTWVAWFATEIAVPDGPWKFCGLPGLIVQVQDSKEHYVFCCKSVKVLHKEEVLPRYFYENSTREDVRDFMNQCYSDIYRYNRMNRVQSYVAKKDASGKTVFEEVNEKEKRAVPYNPIELE